MKITFFSSPQNKWMIPLIRRVLPQTGKPHQGYEKGKLYVLATHHSSLEETSYYISHTAQNMTYHRD